jgi:hypothetical protein
MSQNKPIRYVVINPFQTDGAYSASYNTALGPDRHGIDLALDYAKQTARHGHGEVHAQYNEGGEYHLVRSYLRKEKA